ncbi:hypothetical protein EGM88_12640, partial [Aureibaculum marinum]
IKTTTYYRMFSFLFFKNLQKQAFDVFEKQKTHNFRCGFPFAEKEGIRTLGGLTLYGNKLPLHSATLPFLQIVI